MRRYKLYGRMLEVEPRPTLVEEVSARELGRNASAVLARVSEGRRAIVTRRGTPVAVILEVEEALGLCGTVVLTRRDAQRELLGEELDQRLRDRLVRKLSRGLDRRRSGPVGEAR